MPRLHLITAHRTANRSDEPVVIYCGSDADQALQLRDTALGTGEFALADRHVCGERHTRYASAGQRAAQKAAAPAVVDTPPAPPEPVTHTARRRR